jgi:hypothetical protein
VIEADHNPPAQATEAIQHPEALGFRAIVEVGETSHVVGDGGQEALLGRLHRSAVHNDQQRVAGGVTLGEAVQEAGLPIGGQA